MKKMFLIILVAVLFLTTNFAFALEDSFESGSIDSAKWTQFGSPIPRVISAMGHTGNYALDPYSDESYFSGIYSNERFILSDGFIMRFWLKGFSGSRTTHMRIMGGISDNVVTAQGHTNLIAGVVLDCPNMPTSGYLYFVGGESFREPYINDLYHKIEVRVVSDGRVSFYRDDVLRFTSTTTIDFNIYNNQRIQFFGNYSGMYVDDIYADVRPESISGIAATFANSGIWVCDPHGNSWNRISPSTPDNIISSGSTIYAEFGGGGLWMWNGTTWTQLSPSNPEHMLVSGSTLYVEFGTGGIWRWDGSSWMILTPSNPEKMVVSGSTLYAEFGVGGIWRWNGSSWSMVTPSNPEKIVASGSTLYAEFGAGGIWMWNGSSWAILTPSNPENMVASGSTLYADFSAGGLWQWNGTSWSMLTPSNPENMVVSGSTLYAEFGAGGIWKWNGSSWTMLTPSNPENMVVSGSTLYAEFGAGGIWRLNGSSWTQLTPSNPLKLATLEDGDDPVITPILQGTWTLTSTISSGGLSISESNFYNLTQNNNSISVTSSCVGGFGSITGTYNDPNISFSYTDPDTLNLVTYTGTVSGSHMSGSFSRGSLSGTWFADTSTVPSSKNCIIEDSASTQAIGLYFRSNGQYYVAGEIWDQSSVVQSAYITGPGVSGTMPLTYNLNLAGEWWVNEEIFVSQGTPPSSPLTYVFHVTFKDASSANISRTVYYYEDAQ